MVELWGRRGRGKASQSLSLSAKGSWLKLRLAGAWAGTAARGQSLGDGGSSSDDGGSEARRCGGDGGGELLGEAGHLERAVGERGAGLGSKMSSSSELGGGGAVGGLVGEALEDDEFLLVRDIVALVVRHECELPLSSGHLGRGDRRRHLVQGVGQGDRATISATLSCRSTPRTAAAASLCFWPQKGRSWLCRSQYQTQPRAKTSTSLPYGGSTPAEWRRSSGRGS